MTIEQNEQQQQEVSTLQQAADVSQEQHLEQEQQEQSSEQLEHVEGEQQDEQQEHEKKESGFQRRVNKLNKKIADKEAEAAYWREMALKSQPQLAQQIAPTQPAVQPAADKPQLSQFNNDYEAYTEALTDWKLSQMLAQRQAEEQQRKVAQTYQQRIDEFVKTTPDFAEVMADANDVVAADEILQAVVDSEIGPKIAYYLAKNPEVVERINAMPAHRRLIEMGKLEDRLTSESQAKPASAPQKQPSRAPAPVKPASGGAPVVIQKAPHEMTPQEYIAYRNKTAGRR